MCHNAVLYYRMSENDKECDLRYPFCAHTYERAHEIADEYIAEVGAEDGTLFYTHIPDLPEVTITC